LITAKINDTDLKIKFSYDAFVPSNPRSSVCEILRPNGTEDEVVSIGKATCAPEDNYCKSKGRKLAFARAIRAYDRKVRREFWAVFHNTTGHPNWVK